MPNSPSRDFAARLLRDAGASGLLSAAVLAWRGRREIGSPYAPINAASHLLYGESALRRNALTARHTATGALLHFMSSMLWAGAFELLRSRRREPTALNALADAAAVTALAAVVDLKLAPERLRPGFERRLSSRSLWCFYAGFGIGLALSGVLGSGKRR